MRLRIKASGRKAFSLRQELFLETHRAVSNVLSCLCFLCKDSGGRDPVIGKQKFQVGFDPWAAKHAFHHHSFIPAYCETLHRDTVAAHFSNSGGELV